MLSNSSDRMIPWDTCLSIDKRESLQEAISIREKSLSKSRLDIESSLWLMDELIHLRKLLEFNEERWGNNG